MESKLLELAREVVKTPPVTYDDMTASDFCIHCNEEIGEPDMGYSPHAPDCAWLLLKNEVERLDSQTTYMPQGESLEFAQPRKPMEYEA